MYACNSYGVLLDEDRDHGQAVRLYKKACDADHALACENLAENYLYAHGVPQNEEMSKKLLKKACDLGRRPCKEVVKQQPLTFHEGPDIILAPAKSFSIPLYKEEPMYINFDK
jgi:TPR repeat protein